MKAEDLYEKILGISIPWFISDIDVSNELEMVTVHLSHNSGVKFACPLCDASCGVYDHTSERTWRHLDTCQYMTYLKASVPRVCCAQCGVHSVRTDWSEPGSRFTLLFTAYAIKLLQNSQVISRSAALLRVNPCQLGYLLRKQVDKGLLAGLASQAVLPYLAIDEKSCRRGHNYATIIYDQTDGKVLGVAEDRTMESVKLAYNEALTDKQKLEVKAVSMDMWSAFTTITQVLLPQADIVYDRFHIASYLSDAVDKTRKKEHKSLMEIGDSRLKSTKYLWLTNLQNLSEKQLPRWQVLQEYSELATHKAWQLKEAFKLFFEQDTPEKARSFFDSWYLKVVAHGNSHLLKVAEMLQNHITGLVSYAKHKITNAIAEGINSVIQQVKAKARGFKSTKAFKYAILFYCGKINEYPQSFS